MIKWMVAVIVFPLMPGCIILPTRIGSQRDEFARQYVDTGQIDNIKVDQDTQDFIAAEFGPPPVRFNSNRLWVYTWVETHELRLLLLSMYGAAEKDYPMEDDTSYLVLQFDGEGILRKKRIRNGGYLNHTATTIDNAFR